MTALPDLDLPQLAELCLGHVAREESSLREARDGLADLRSALVAGDPGRVRAALQRQVRVAVQCDGLRRERSQTSERLALKLGLDPDTVTLSQVANRLPAPWADRVAAARDRLRLLAADADALNRRNAKLVEQCRDFLAGLLDEFAAGDAAGRAPPPAPTGQPAAPWSAPGFDRASTPPRPPPRGPLARPAGI